MDFSPSTDQRSTAADDPVLRPPPAVPPARRSHPSTTAEPASAAATLAAAETGSVGGMVELQQVRRLTSVFARLIGGHPWSTYEGTIRQGACSQPGAMVTTLTPVSVDSTGRGAATTDTDIPVSDLVQAPHVVVYGRGGRPESCGSVAAARR